MNHGYPFFRHIGGGRNLKDRLGAEGGLTIVEVMVAAMVLVIGAFAIFKIVDAATRTSYRAEQSQVVSNLLQRELEKIKARDVADVAVSSAPDACRVELAPELVSRWGSSSFDGREWIMAPADADNPIVPCEQMTAAADGEGSDSSDVAVNVYRVVTWYDPDNEDCLPPGEGVEETEACGMRRIIVGAKPIDTASGGERSYREIQSDVVNISGSEPG
jgi:Tfp pilus assembly protein PilV